MFGRFRSHSTRTEQENATGSSVVNSTSGEEDLNAEARRRLRGSRFSKATPHPSQFREALRKKAAPGARTPISAREKIHQMREKRKQVSTLQQGRVSSTSPPTSLAVKLPRSPTLELVREDDDVPSGSGSDSDSSGLMEEENLGDRQNSAGRVTVLELLIREPNKVDRKVLLKEGKKCTIGRHASSTIRLMDRRVSSHHAVIQGLCLTDRSTNGTWQGRQRVLAPLQLVDGCSFQIGITKFEVRATSISASSSSLLSKAAAAAVQQSPSRLELMSSSKKKTPAEEGEDMPLAWHPAFHHGAADEHVVYSQRNRFGSEPHPRPKPKAQYKSMQRPPRPKPKTLTRQTSLGLLSLLTKGDSMITSTSTSTSTPPPPPEVPARPSNETWSAFIHAAQHSHHDPDVAGFLQRKAAEAFRRDL